MNRSASINQLTRLAAVAWMAGACSQPLTVEQEVIATIRDMESSIESGERRPFIAHVDKNFNGQDAVMTRDQLNALILYQLNRHAQVQVQFMPIHITPAKNGEAEAYFDVLLTGGPGWLPDSGQVFSFVTRWHQQGGEWLLLSANWKPVTIDPMSE
jgi:hypothetical protein